NRVRLRLTTTASLAACTASVLSVTGVLWPRSSWAVLALMVALAGWHGRRENRPFLDPAVVVQRARKLTPDLVTHAFQAAGLAKADRVDFWKGFRFGQDARKRPVRLAMVWSSLLVGAIPRMGKTFAARLPAAAGALDPWVQLFVFDGKGGKDWQPFELVAHR